MTPRTFIDSFTDACPHWWPASGGAGARGSTNVSATADIDVRMKAAADSGDMKLYRKLRAERKKAAG